MDIIHLFLFMTGACFGSFAGVVIYRLPRNESLIKGRSYCEYCHQQLRFYELIPILSYLFLKGRCHHCQRAISIKYLWIECLGGILALLSFYRFGFSIQTIVAFFISIDLLIIALIDWQTMDIYVSTMIVFLFLACVLSYLQGMLTVKTILESLYIPFMMMLINAVVEQSFGFGDIELICVSGVMLGWLYNLLAIMISVLLAGMIVFYLLLIKKVNRKEHIAFGPYLVIGILISLFFGTEILMGYLGMFF